MCSTVGFILRWLTVYRNSGAAVKDRRWLADRTNLALDHALARTQPIVPTTGTPAEVSANGRRLLHRDAEDWTG